MVNLNPGIGANEAFGVASWRVVKVMALRWLHRGYLER